MNESRQAYYDWLASLQVGDTVCIEHQWYGYTVLTIEKITPTRQIKTTQGYTFKNGRCKDGKWNNVTLEPYTQRIADILRKYNLLDNCMKLTFDKLSTEQLEAILKVTGGYIQPKTEVSDPNQAKLEL